jgi:PAS domain S-box-containing protein
LLYGGLFVPKEDDRMTDFFRGQMDYILFFYGLSFVVLSVICFIMTKAGERRLPWVWLGLFGITHGMHEWLDVPGIGLRELFLFRIPSLLLLFLSFAALAEFGRAGTRAQVRRGPGRWIFIPLIAGAATGALNGFEGLEASSRLFIGLPAALLSSFVLLRFSRGERRVPKLWMTVGSASLALYAVFLLAGSPSSFPVPYLNAVSSIGLSGLPVEFVRGLLAFTVALSVWAYSQTSSSEPASGGRRAIGTFLPVGALVVILAFGWVVTETAGRQAKTEEMKEGALYAGMLSDRISDVLADTAATASSRAESPRIAAALISGRSQDVAQARLALDQCRNIKEEHAPFCYLYNSSGKLVASCDRARKIPDIPRYRGARFSPSGDYEFDGSTRKWFYRADAPVKDGKGRFLGTVVITEKLKEAEGLMRKRPYAFLVDPHGIVFLSSNENFCLKSLWPIDKDAQGMLVRSGKFGRGPFPALMKKEVREGNSTLFAGRQFLVSRFPVARDGWSVILLNPTRLVTAYRLFSIFATFFFFSLTVGFFSLMYFTRASAEELRKAKEELEVRVEERTSELGYVNDELLREIAERKLSEKALKISEEKYKNLIELTPDVIYLSDIDGHIIFINEACRRIFDASPEDVTGTLLMDWVHPEDRDMTSEKFSGILKKGLDVFEFEGRFVSTSGRTVNVLHNIRAISNENGDIVGTQGITRDITERKRAERLIEKLNRRNELILSSAGEGIYGVDLAGATTFINPAARKMLGWTKEEMLGRSQHDLIHHSRADGTAYPSDECRIYAAFRSGRVCHADDEVFWRKDGTSFPVEYVSTPIVEDGAIVGAVVIFRDIGERKRAEDGLRESEERFRSLYNMASDCILQLTPGENGPPVIVDVNVSACVMHGYTREEMIGKPLTFLSSESSRGVMLNAVKRIMLGETMTFEVEHMRKGGVVFSVEVSAHLIYIGGVAYILAIDRDITERRKIEEALRERDRTQKAILNNIPDMAWLKDRECRFISTNEAFGKTCGVHPEDLPGATDFDIWPRHLAEKYHADDIEVMQTGKGKQVEEQMIDQGGRRIWIETIKTPIYNDSGEVIGTTGISRDITERKSTEEKLKLFSQAIEEAMDGVQIVGLDGRIIYSNLAIEEIYGFSRHELSGKDLSEMTADPEIMEREILPSIRERGYWSGEVTVFHNKGRTFPIWLSASMVKGSRGEPIAMVGFVRDITERNAAEEELKRHREHLVEMVEERTLELQTAVQFLTQEIGFRKKAEETLKESEARFRELFQQFHTLLDAIPDVLLLLSSDLKVLWANSSATSRLGGTVSDLSGKHCFELWHDSCDPCEDCHVIKTFRSGEAAISKRTANGRLLDSRAFPIKDEDGRVTNAIVVVSDITEKVTLEAEAMRASHLASLGELAAGVAHEINNPINGIINYAQMIVNRSPGTRENEIAGRIIKEGNRIAGIVRSLLSFARERKEEKAAVNIRKILYETITLTEAQIRKDGIRLDMDCPEFLPAVVANPQQLQQVFLNIISNARYALNVRYPLTDEKKVLAISCRRAVMNDVPWLEITFLDQGTGIPPDTVEKVMNPFFSTKPSGEGTGLGLSISHGIVKDHGGRLLVESVEGSFTKISIHFPAEEEHGA